MPDIGVRDLKTHATEIIRDVRERDARYVITYRRQPVALLIPLDKVDSNTTAMMTEASETPAWDELTRLGKEIGSQWRSSQTSAVLLSEMRR
ncbi:MAG: type II toxin-antitoxin system prevent-host-death family antitoxin [Candidatus Poribacteria bacterium]|nr:type II toxin-antitoxin system prevent-host-death family antitoxin [Candidatus Poribacteria bacterium]